MKNESHPSHINLSISEKIDLLRGVDLNTVMLYLEMISGRAKGGNAESAKEVFWIALSATKGLETIVEQDASMLNDVPLHDVPVVMGRNGIKEKKDISAKAKMFGAKWERKRRKKSNPRIRGFVEAIVSELNEIRLKEADDNNNKHQDAPIEAILSENGWQVDPQGPELRGWRNAAAFLPKPTRANATLWWSVAERLLKDRYESVDSPKWFEHPEIVAVCGLPKRKGINDTNRARGAWGKQVRDRFKEAVNRVPL